jgi:hypothetical protein
MIRKNTTQVNENSHGITRMTDEFWVSHTPSRPLYLNFKPQPHPLPPNSHASCRKQNRGYSWFAA